MAMADISLAGTSQFFQRKTNVSLYHLNSSFLPQKPVKFSYNFNSEKRFTSLKVVCSVAPSQTQTPTPVPTTTVTADGKRTDCFGIFCLTYDLKEEEKQKSWKKLIKVAVSGAAGMISNHLLFMIASGEAFGQDQPIALQLLGSERSFAALEGVAMELEDSLYPLLREVSIGVDPNEVFRDVEWALLIGAKPRGPGMERADLLDINGQIFAEQGKALNAVASPNVKVLVVGNPCNTNALICLKNAPKIPPKNFHALTRLDENRAKCQLALKAGVFYDKVSNMTIWGNHSTTQVPDYLNAKIHGMPVKEIITDIKWLEEEFTKKVQTRGGVLIKKWGRSSAASTAVSIVDAIKSLTIPTPEGDWFSTGSGPDERSIPGNTIAVQADKPFGALTRFGSAFLSKFECSQMPHPLLEHFTFVDTPGVLAGEKQRTQRSYDFTGVTSWFAAKCDLILLFFDPYKLDISDELKRVIGSLRGHDDKIRVVLNKADQVDTQHLMRVYGALMWSLGKVLNTPEVTRVYIGSFNDKPIDEAVFGPMGKELFEREQEDLLVDLKDIPRKACDRRINEFVKRARAAKIHAYIISHLKKEMPTMMGKAKAQQRLIDNLEEEFTKVQKEFHLPVGDFPDVEHYKKVLSGYQIDRFEKLKPKMIQAVDDMLGYDIPDLLKKFQNPYD